MPAHRVNRLSNDMKEQDAAHLGAVRATIAEVLKMLRDCSRPDTIAGRKTQDPFPEEDEDTRLAKWLALRELKSPQ